MCFHGNMAVNTIQASAPIGTLRRLAISLLSVLLRSKRLANPAFCAFLYSRSPWLYADRVGVGSLGRTFRRSRNPAGAFAPAGVPSGTQCAPASSAAFPHQRRVRLQSTKKKELSSIKKDPFRGLLLCSRCLPLYDLRAEHYALVYSVSAQYVQDRLCRRHALVIQHIIQRRQCRRGHLRIKRVVDPDH